MIREQIRITILVFLILTLLTGVLYPLFITLNAQLFFYKKANGSLIYKNNKILGSKLIGQEFTDPKYFWGRISLTSSFAYNSAESCGSNFGPTNQALLDMIELRIKALKEVDPNNRKAIPVDLVTSSASGLDPHISVAAAYYQIARVAKARGVSKETIKSVIKKCTYHSFLGLIGKSVVNVLELNLALDEIEI